MQVERVRQHHVTELLRWKFDMQVGRVKQHHVTYLLLQKRINSGDFTAVGAFVGGKRRRKEEKKKEERRFAFTRSHRSISSAESNRSALTDHAVQENHVISWSAASVIDRESDRSTRWIKEAVHIRKEGPRSMNRDEGSYQLSHTYDRFLGSTLLVAPRTGRRPSTSVFWWRPLIEVETSKVNNFLVVFDEICSLLVY